MFKIVKKRYFIPSILSVFLLIGVSFKDDFFEISKQIEIFTTLFKTINQNYVDDTNPAELMDKAIKSMLADLDPYTNYFNEQDVIKFKINNTGEYTGIGAMITRKEDKLIIKEPYKGFPADKAGLKAGDEITQIGDVLLADFKDDASQLMKGAKGTKIKINYLRQGKPMSTQLILDEVAVKAVPFYGMVDDKTGYIVLSQFNQKASYETKEALEKLKDDGATQIVLDLRGNPGGLLNEAVTICNLFVPKNEIIVTTKSKNSKYNNTYKTNKDPVDTEIPLVVIVDGKSASASEIVSGALQDLDRAVVIGSRSFGKGLVQRPIDLTYGTQVKVTISKYYTPSGRCIQRSYSGNFNDYYGEEDRYSRGELFYKDSMYKDLKLKYKTKKGRTVYGGGGIIPDVFVPLDSGQFFSGLNHFQLIFSPFVFNQLSQKAEKWKNLEELKNYTFSANEWTNLLRYVETKLGIKAPKIPSGKDKETMERYLKLEYARQIWQEQGYYKLSLTFDHEIQEALKTQKR